MDLRLGRTENEPTYWPVLSDLSITILLLLALFLALTVLSGFKIRRRAQALAQIQGVVAAKLHMETDTTGLHIYALGDSRQRLTFSADLLFATCKADLRPAGRAQIEAVGRVLAQYSPYLESVDVEGHTDRGPVRTTADCPFDSNWELSSERATSVVRVLSDGQFVPGNRLAATGYSEYRPVDPNNLDANRRVEIVLFYSVDAAVARMDSAQSSRRAGT